MTKLAPHYLSCLLELVKKVNSTLNLKDLVNSINQELINLLKIESSALLMVDYSNQEFLFLPAENHKSENIPTETKVPIDSSIAGLAALNNEAFYLENVTKNLPFYRQQINQLYNTAIHNLAVVPLSTKGNIIGVLEIINKPEVFTPEDQWFLEELSFHIANSLENARLYENCCHQLKSTFAAFSNAIDKRDSYTHFHSKRVRDYALIIGEKTSLNQSQNEKLELAAILHDIGKIGIRDNILLKPSQLTSWEFTLIKAHPLKGAEILSFLEGISNEIVSSVRHHHEKWDGNGYPDGLSGKEIPYLARIITICDVFDAMTTDRPYRPRISAEEARSYIIEHQNEMFDPELVDVFRSAYPEMISMGNLG